MRPSAVLTPDVIAHAIVASAQAYGDDPVRVFLARGGPARRCMTPAAEALCLLTGYSYAKLAPLLQLAPRGVSRARVNGGYAYERAFEAAEARLRALGLERPSFPALKGASVAPSPTATTVPTVIEEAPAPPADDPAEPAVQAMRQLQTLCRQRPPIVTAVAARRMVQSALMEGPATGPDLMEALNLSEGQVRQALTGLADAGLVLSTPRTAEGWRAQFWRVTQADAVAAAGGRS